MSYTIGDVIVHRGEPHDGNPHHGIGSSYDKDAERPFTALIGDERREALRKFKHGEPTSEFTYWYAPYSGGIRHIKHPVEIDWETSGIK